MITQKTDYPVKGATFRRRGIEYPIFVTLPICTSLSSPDFPQMQSQLLTTVRADSVHGAQSAVIAPSLRPKRGSKNKLYLIRPKGPDEEIEYGHLYLIETARGRMFRIVNPNSACSVRLKTCGVCHSESLVQLSKIVSMWRVCAVMDYLEPKDDTEED